MNKLTSLLYISRSQVEGPFEGAAIAAILETARRNNAADNVTGALMLDNGHFIQVLEGDRSVVDGRFTSIKRDRRHTEVAVIGQNLIVTRRFAHWSMAYLSAAKAQLALGGITIEELRRKETPHAAGVIDAMARFAMPPFASTEE